MRGISAPKIPTTICYKPQGIQAFKWGAATEYDPDAIVGIKLHLDPTQKRPAYLPGELIQKELKSLPKPAIEVAADFIGALFKHAYAEIGRTVPREYMDMCSKEFVLSGITLYLPRINRG